MNVENVSKMNAILMDVEVDVEVDDAADDTEDDVVVAIEFLLWILFNWL